MTYVYELASGNRKYNNTIMLTRAYLLENSMNLMLTRYQGLLEF